MIGSDLHRVVDHVRFERRIAAARPQEEEHRGYRNTVTRYVPRTASPSR